MEDYPDCISYPTKGMIKKNNNNNNNEIAIVKNMNNTQD